MAKPSSTRKVAKVARTGGGRTRRGQSSWFFPALMTAVAVLGVFLIGFSRAQRQPDTTRPRIGADHWHSAIGFDICGTFAPSIPDNGQDPLGIHTHGDGIVHTHPFSSQAAGRKATLGVFFDTLNLTVTESKIEIPGNEKSNGDSCGDQPGKVRVKVWDSRSPTDNGRIVEGDPADIRLGDSQLITVAFVAEGADIPKPPSEAELDRLSDLGTNTPTTVTASTIPVDETTSVPGTIPDTPASTSTSVP